MQANWGIGEARHGETIDSKEAPGLGASDVAAVVGAPRVRAQARRLRPQLRVGTLNSAVPA